MVVQLKLIPTQWIQLRHLNDLDAMKPDRSISTIVSNSSRVGAFQSLSATEFHSIAVTIDYSTGRN